jgi:hypothetical protein
MRTGSREKEKIIRQFGKQLHMVCFNFTSCLKRLYLVKTESNLSI